MKTKWNRLFTATAWITGIALLCTGIFAGIRLYPWGQSKTSQQAQEQEAQDDESNAASEKVPESAEGTKAVHTTADVTEQTSVEDVMVKRGILTEEDKAAQAEYGEDAYAAIKPDGNAEEDASLDSVESYRREQWKSMVPSEVRWKSYSIDLKDGSETRVTSSAKDLGYVKYDITSALELAFPCEKDDEQAIGEEILARLGNPFVAGTWIRGTANIKYDGEMARSIKGNEFFNEFILEDRKAYSKDREEFEEIMKEDAAIDGGYTFDYDYDKIPGPGGDGLNHWVTSLGEDEDGNMIFILNDNYCELVGDWYAWFMGTHAFYGAKDWQTRAKSVLDNRNSRRARPQFTDEPDRQENLTSFIYAGIDKNGNRTSEFWGINRCTSDWCIFGGTSKGDGKVIIYNPPVQDNKASQGWSASQSTSTSNPSNPDKPDNPDKPKSKSKHKEASSVNKPQNIINGKDPVGQGTDAFQSTKPDEPASTVAEAQYQPTDQTQAVLDNGGNKTTPGTEGPDLPNPGSTNQPTSGGGTSDYTTTPGGVVVEDHREDETHRTENETAETPTIEQKPDNDGDGTSKDNTGMPSGFGF